MKKTLAILITTFSLSLGLTPGFTGISGNLVIEAAAHPGRTDANGGKRKIPQQIPCKCICCVCDSMAGPL